MHRLKWVKAVSVDSYKMAFTGDRRRYVFIFDSRGRHLESILKRENIRKLPVDMLFFDGADIEDLYREAVNYCRLRPFNIVFLVGGICSVTTKDKMSKKISFDWNDSDSLLNYILQEITNGEKYFATEMPASKVVLCRYVGADLSKVLKRLAENEQFILDNAIYELNERIFKMNIEKGLYALDMATPVHRKNKNNVNISHYHHLCGDGIHLSQDLRIKWVKKMLSTAEKFQ